MSDMPPPPPSSPPPEGGWQQPPQQIVVKQGPGCLKIGLIVAGILVILGIGVVGCLAVVGNEVVKEIDRSMGEAATSDYEVSDIQCSVDDILGPQATGTIQNTSEKAQGFQIEVRFETTDGALISADSTFTDTINVNQSQPWTVTSFDDLPEGSELTCDVSEVSYTIFDNEED